MKCPICNTSNGIEIDMHSDGYAKDLLECSSCDAIWLAGIDGIIMVNKQAA